MFIDKARAPEGVRLYVIGDIHGHLDLLKILVKKIRTEIKEASNLKHRLIFIGDYCDRGPDTKGVFDFLVALAENYNVIYLMGNHDSRMLKFADKPNKVGRDFLRLGGDETLRSYGIKPDKHASLKALGERFSAKLPKAHRRFLGAALYCHVEGDYFFAHAGVRPAVALDQQRPADLMWIRDEFLEHSGDFGKVVVHGHTITKDVEIRSNRINVDTGAFRTGRLSCIVLEGKRRRILQT